MPGSLFFGRKAAKSLKKLKVGQPSVARRIAEKIRDLRDEPLPAGVRPLQGMAADPRVYRLRVGQYRVLYRLGERDGMASVEILDIRHRKEVYRDL